MPQIKTIIVTAIARARLAVVQGLTVEHLTSGWDMPQADCDALIGAVGRNLTPEEWEIASRAFKQEVRVPTPAPSPPAEEPELIYATTMASTSGWDVHRDGDAYVVRSWTTSDYQPGGNWTERLPVSSLPTAEEMAGGRVMLAALAFERAEEARYLRAGNEYR